MGEDDEGEEVLGVRPLSLLHLRPVDDHLIGVLTRSRSCSQTTDE